MEINTKLADSRNAKGTDMVGLSNISAVKNKGGYARVVVTLLFFSTFINFLDRQTLSIIAPLLRDQFAISSIGYSRIVFAFLLGYTVAQTFAGKLIDRLGARNGMLICVAAWSVAAMMHGLAMGFASFCAARVLLGIAEAGNWPGAVKSVSETVSPEHRGLAVGLFNSGSFIAAIFAPPAVVALVRLWGWRLMFVLVGLTGIIWVWFWSRFYEKKISTTLRVENQPKATAILVYLRNPAVWGLIVGRFLADPVWWFYAFWLPEYFVRSRGFDLTSIGHVLWIPFLFAALGSGFGGYASGLLIRRGNAAVSARKVLMVSGAALMLLGVAAFRAQNSLVAVAWICVVLFGYSSWATNILSLATDLFSSDEVARVTGISGTAGAIGGMIFTLITGWLVQSGSYGPVFGLASGMIFFAATAAVCLIPARKPADWSPV
jgi:ACS family hexuronate transporter-like MFS transporter